MIVYCRYLYQNIYIFGVRRYFSSAALIPPRLASGHSLTGLMSESLALRSKKRLMGELISSGFYTRNQSLHCDPLTGK